MVSNKEFVVKLKKKKISKLVSFLGKSEAEIKYWKCRQKSSRNC